MARDSHAVVEDEEPADFICAPEMLGRDSCLAFILAFEDAKR